MEDRTDVSSKNSTEEPKLGDWLSYYKILIEDIRYAKNQQWHLAYYTLLLLGGVVALSETIKPESLGKIVLFIAALALAFFGTYYLWKFEKKDLKRYRNNVSKIQNYFPVSLRGIAEYKPAKKRGYYSDFLWFITVIIWGAVFFVGWAIGFWQLLFCSVICDCSKHLGSSLVLFLSG